MGKKNKATRRSVNLSEAVTRKINNERVKEYEKDRTKGLPSFNSVVEKRLRIAYGIEEE